MSGFDHLENYRLPELSLPPREGWKVDREDTPNGPNYHAQKAGDPGQGFRLTNRHFDQIDAYMSGKLLHLLQTTIESNPGRKIVVLDVGGGALSECMRGMLQHPLLKGKVLCINVDLFAQKLDPEELAKDGIDPQDLIVLNADFLEQQMLPGSADVVFSYQVLDHTPDALIPKIVEKVGRVLAPGGTAYLNERWNYTRCSPMDPWVYSPGMGMFGEPHWMQALADAEDVRITVAYGETDLYGQTHIFGASRCPFIYMTKRNSM